MTEDVYLLGDGLLGPLSKRPSPTQEVRWYIDKDTGVAYVSNGTSWIQSGGVSLPGVTSGPAAFAEGTPAPDYNPTYTFVGGDTSNVSSAYGRALVAFFHWTPTSSGTVTLSPPYDDGISTFLNFGVYAGTVLGVDVPTRDGSGSQPDTLADAGFATDGSGYDPNGAQFAVTSGLPYTLAVALYPDTDTSLPVGRVVSLKPWVYSTQALGGQATLVPYSSAATGPLALREGRKTTAWGAYSHAEGYGTTSAGQISHAEGQNTSALSVASHAEGNATVASGEHAHAEGNTTTASGSAAHAEGQATAASAYDAHAEGFGTAATGGASHAEGTNTSASGVSAHAEGESTVASGQNSHAGGLFSTASALGAFAHGHQVTADADFAHAEGHKTATHGKSGHAEGHSAIARLHAEHAHASGTFAADGDAQFSRLVVWGSTANATPTQLLVENADDPQSMTVPANHTWTIQAQVSASRSDTPGTVAGFILGALVTTVGGTLRLVGSPTSSKWNDAAGSSWVAALAVNADHVDVIVAGEAGKTIRWVAAVHVVQVGL